MKNGIERRVFIKSIVLGATGLMVRNYNVSASEVSPDSILVKMIFNNIGSDPNYKKSWGLAIWIEQDKDAVLFDTGDNAETLWKNIEAAGVDLTRLSKIIISHDHNDHTDGLPVVLEKTNYEPVVYVNKNDACSIIKKFSNITLKTVTDPVKITGSIWSTGQMRAFANNFEFYEQSVIIIKNNIQYILTGCAHSGVVEITERAIQMHPDIEISLLAGGFHLSLHSPEQVKQISDKLKELKVRRIAPSHCTGAKAIEYFRTSWKEKFVDFNLGESFTV